MRMRWLATLGALLAMGLPALAAEAAPSQRADDLLGALRTERFRIEGQSGSSARKAARALEKGERFVSRLARRLHAGSTDAKGLTLLSKAGRWIAAARNTGEVGAGAPAITQWGELVEACRGDAQDVIDIAMDTRDRLWSAHLRDKVSRRLDKGLEMVRDADRMPSASDRTKLLARAVRQVEGALRKARKLCTKETRPSCPRGLVAESAKLTYRGRGSLTIFDIEWHVSLRTLDGSPVGTRDGVLSDPGRILPTRLPWSLARGETMDALAASGVSLGQGHRIDGVVTWTTSAGEIEVPVHIDQ